MMISMGSADMWPVICGLDAPTPRPRMWTDPGHWPCSAYCNIGVNAYVAGLPRYCVPNP